MTTVDLVALGQLALPHSRFRARIAEALFRRAVRRLPVRILLPTGEVLGAGDADSPAMHIVRPAAFFHRLGVDAKIGFGESYMARDWMSDEPADLLTPFARRMATLVPKPLQVFRRLVDRRQPDTERNTIAGSKRNIERHYDLSNELFANFLDETMTYSAAWFPPDGDDLTEAQLRKIDGILDYAGVRRGSRVLEIGTGWGELAIRAARRGARVTSLTISSEQKALAERRIAAAGLSDLATVEIRDYRQASGTYDAIVSVEMIEAVGREYWPTYFAALQRLLAPEGRVGLQAITMPHDRLLASSYSHTWIHKYIFPGGQLLSVPAIEQHSHLRIVERRSLGGDYARTLRHWRQRFNANWDTIAALGFDATFQRMWEFYLAYCEAGFRSGYLDVWQLAFARER